MSIKRLLTLDKKVELMRHYAQCDKCTYIDKYILANNMTCDVCGMNTRNNGRAILLCDVGVCGLITNLLYLCKGCMEDFVVARKYSSTPVRLAQEYRTEMRNFINRIKGQI